MIKIIFTHFFILIHKSYFAIQYRKACLFKPKEITCTYVSANNINQLKIYINDNMLFDPR